jgi:general secretion pathway protein D
MTSLSRLGKFAGFVALVAMAVSPTLDARTKKGDKLLALSRAAELRKEWDKSLELAEQALSEDPADVAYQLTTTRLRFYTSQYHIDLGRKLREQGQLEQALAEFQKAYGINPASAMAEEEISRTKRMIESEQNKPAAEQKPEERGLTPTEVVKRKDDKRFASMQPLPELKALNATPITLKMSNQPPKVLFETVGKLAGINVLFDPDYTAQQGVKPQSIELNNATLEEALDYLSLITRSFWKPVSQNAIFVTQENPTKRREFEDWAVKVFYLKNVTTAQEMQEIVTALRTVAEIQKIFTYQAQTAIIVRAEADKLALAEKIVSDLDKPKPEVVVDILVMQVSRAKTRDLTAAVASSGLNVPIAFTPRSSISTTIPGNGGSNGGSAAAASAVSTAIPLANIGKISTHDYSLTLPSGLLEALINDRNSKVLQSPQVRAIDGMKVSLKIGDKVPYATGSFQPGIGGVGINPLVNTQFTFLDVGVNVDIVPKVHGPNEVSLHVEVDISNVKERINLGGIESPVVGQSKIINDVRLKQGEVNLLGGLMQVQETKSVTGVPGLSSIPVLRRLFTSESVTKDYSELVIALIPHIVRTPEISEVNLRGVSAGNSTTVKLTYAQPKPPEAPQPAAPVPGTAVAPAPQPAVPAQSPNVAAPGQPVPVIPGVNAPPVNLPVSPGAPPLGIPTAPPAKPEGQPAPAVPSNARVMFAPAQASAQLNGTLTVNLTAENVADLASTPMQIRFDPKILRLNDVVRGDLLASDGQQVAFSKNVLNDSGEATINVSRFPTTGGVSGSGSLVTLVFQAVGKGDTVVTAQLSLRNSQSQPILTVAPQLAASVK